MSTPEPLTPLAVEMRLRQLVNDLTRAQIVLREARDAESMTPDMSTTGHVAVNCCPKSPRRSHAAATPPPSGTPGWTTSART